MAFADIERRSFLKPPKYRAHRSFSAAMHVSAFRKSSNRKVCHQIERHAFFSTRYKKPFGKIGDVAKSFFQKDFLQLQHDLRRADRNR